MDKKVDVQAFNCLNKNIMSESKRLVYCAKDSVIEYSIRRMPKRKKTSAVTIKPEVGVVGLAPIRTPVSSIDRFIKSRADWIIKKKDELQKLTKERKKYFVAGEAVRLLGSDYPLAFEKADLKRVQCAKLSNERVLVRMPLFEDDKERIAWGKRSLILWYRKQADEIIRKAVRRISIHIGTTPEKVFIKDLKSSWGICRDKNISFNWRLVMAPVSIIEYVVAHEICHLEQKDHSKKFWKKLESVQPDYKARKAELRRIGLSLDV